MLNYVKCTDPPTKLANDFEIKQFLKRSNAKPVQVTDRKSQTSEEE